MRFNSKNYIEGIRRNLKENVKGRVLVTLSGGVDSSTSAGLIEKSGLENELLFIDTGFLRVGESVVVKKVFRGRVKILNVSNLFHKNLKHKITPAEKREVFRQTYFRVIKDYALQNNFPYIVQGTQFHKTSTKRYHNSPTQDFLRSGIKVIEPVKGMAKSQIRLIAKNLYLPKEIVNRRPFPGPGLLIRFSGEYQENKLQLIRKITFVVDKFVEQNKKEFENCYQIFPYLTDEYAPFVNKKNKGVVGQIVLIRAITSNIVKNNIIYKPFAIPGHLQHKFVEKIMNLGNISRVCFDSTIKNGFGDKVKYGGTIEYA